MGRREMATFLMSPSQAPAGFGIDQIRKRVDERIEAKKRKAK
jgi:hypothetical protein